MDMRHACQCVENIGLSNRKLKATIKCTVWSQCTPVSDRQANIVAIAWRFILTSASHAKNGTVFDKNECCFLVISCADVRLAINGAAVIPAVSLLVHNTCSQYPRAYSKMPVPLVKCIVQELLVDIMPTCFSLALLCTHEWQAHCWTVFWLIVFRSGLFDTHACACILWRPF